MLKSLLRLLASIAVSAIALAPAARADFALLTNGMRLRVERQERDGDRLRLFVDGGYLDVAPADVQEWEYEQSQSPVVKTEVVQKKATDLPSLLANAGWRQGLDPALLRSMVAEESNFRPDAVSRKGARGLMQLMPPTGESLGIRDPFSPDQNVHGGAQYIRVLLERYKGDLAKALAAYNAGPAAVDRYNGIPPYPETQKYVRRVITRFNREKTQTLK